MRKHGLRAIWLALFVVISSLTVPANAQAISIPQYDGDVYTVINDNEPDFTQTQKKNTKAFEKYSKLDDLGRCGVAFANICKEIMPTKPREDISKVLPSGWQKNSGWQRCHLIGFQLAGENANKKNLITGTETFNVKGMLPFENMVDDYVDETNNHVLYRVTPLFKGKELVARGVQMEAWSVEDGGDGICFNVFVHNVTPGKSIDYATGKVDGGPIEQWIDVKTLNKTYKDTELKSAKKTFSLGVSVTSGTYTVKKTSGDSALSVNSKGTVTVKKSTKAGSYSMKVSITATATDKSKKTITKTVKVTVTKDASSGTTVYWTPNGSVYHLTKSCSTLSKSKTILSGTVAESNKPRVCKVCSK